MKTMNIFKVITLTLLMAGSAPLFAATTANTTQNPDTSPTVVIKDMAITAYIRSQIAFDRNLSNFNLDIRSHNGVVSLAGEVDSDSEVQALRKLIESSPGVKRVDTMHLVVKKSTQPMADMLITAEVKGTFFKEKLFGKSDVSVMSIRVETNNGVVYLTGTADNEQQVKNAVTLAQSVSGVSQVKSLVNIMKQDPESTRE